MKTIASFTVDHDRLEKGMYLSRVDGDVVTYDVRMKKPNGGDYLGNGALHTIEHLFATYVRNSAFEENIVYFGPMGCRTGFYFLTRGMTHAQAIALTKEALGFIAAYEGAVPGATKIECGNYREHDLTKAREYAAALANVLKNWTEKDLTYPSK